MAIERADRRGSHGIAAGKSRPLALDESRSVAVDELRPVALGCINKNPTNGAALHAKISQYGLKTALCLGIDYGAWRNSAPAKGQTAHASRIRFRAEV